MVLHSAVDVKSEGSSCVRNEKEAKTVYFHTSAHLADHRVKWVWMLISESNKKCQKQVVEFQRQKAAEGGGFRCCLMIRRALCLKHTEALRAGLYWEKSVLTNQVGNQKCFYLNRE